MKRSERFWAKVHRVPFVEALTDETRMEKLKKLIAKWEDEDE